MTGIEITTGIGRYANDSRQSSGFVIPPLYFSEGDFSGALVEIYSAL